MGRNFNDRRPEKGPRVNRQIRVPRVRVVAEEGQVGIMPTHIAIQQAEDAGLDLVEVSPDANPPVCRIIDYGKYKYEQSKKEAANKKKQGKQQVKQIKLRPKTDEHDISFKTKNARKFLEAGNKVQFEIQYRGRENAHPETGKALLDDILVRLEDVAKIERVPKYENRSMIMIVAPK